MFRFRDQFPPLPTAASSASSAPTVPAWQLASNASRQTPSLVNGGYKHGSNSRFDDRRFLLGSDGYEDDDISADGFAGSDEPYVSAAGSENGEKTTPV